MRNHKETLEIIANDLLNQQANSHNKDIKPNYSTRDFVNTVIIFQTALMDKMYDMQEIDRISIKDRINMADSCGKALHNLIRIYTGINLHDENNLK